jgi:hypothetical protein
MNANQLILDYVAICEKRGEVLNLADFVELWTAANHVAEETVAADFEERGLGASFAFRSAISAVSPRS